MNKYIGLFLLFVILVWICIIANFILSALLNSEDNKTSLIYELKRKLLHLFRNKNRFGIILSGICIIFLIPGILPVILIEIVIMIKSLVIYIWECGNK